MRVGCPKEIKTHEYRVGLTPESAAELVRAGHEVLMETKAGEGIGASDERYKKIGAKILPDADAVFDEAEMIVKVKEPQAVEIARLKPKHTLFTYLHLAPDPEQAEGLMKSGATCIAYETVTDRGRAPAAAEADERSGGAHVDPGRRALPGEGARRARRADGRRAGRAAGRCRDPRRRRGRLQRGADRGRHARARDRVRQEPGAAGRARPRVQRPAGDGLFDQRGDRGGDQGGRCRHRRGAGRGRGGARS